MPFKGSYEEKEILSRLAAGDKSAFDALYHYYEPRLRLFLTPFIRPDGHMLNMILQDTFVKCWIKRTDLAAIEHLETYLQRMAKNRLLDLLKLQKIQLGHIGNYARSQEQSIEHTKDQLQLKEYMTIARQGIEALPERRRQILTLSVFEGLSIDEIASRMDLSRDVVKKQLQKARAFLKAWISQKGDLPAIVGGLIIGSLQS